MDYSLAMTFLTAADAKSNLSISGVKSTLTKWWGNCTYGHNYKQKYF